MVVQGVRIRKMVQLVTLVLTRCCAPMAAGLGCNHAIEVRKAWRGWAACVVGATFLCQLSSIAVAQSDSRRPMRQVETDDGVIVLTNSPDRAPDQTATEVTPTASRELALTPERPPPVPARADRQRGFSIGSWLFPLVMLGLVATAAVWGWRRLASRRAATRAGPSEPSSHAELAEAELLEAELLESPVDELPALSNQWVDALRDSVPPSAPGRSSVRSVPPQWVSQPLRKPSES